MGNFHGEWKKEVSKALISKGSLPRCLGYHMEVLLPVCCLHLKSHSEGQGSYELPSSLRRPSKAFQRTKTKSDFWPPKGWLRPCTPSPALKIFEEGGPQISVPISNIGAAGGGDTAVGNGGMVRKPEASAPLSLLRYTTAWEQCFLSCS